MKKINVVAYFYNLNEIILCKYLSFSLPDVEHTIMHWHLIIGHIKGNSGAFNNELTRSSTLQEVGLLPRLGAEVSGGTTTDKSSDIRLLRARGSGAGADGPVAKPVPPLTMLPRRFPAKPLAASPLELDPVGWERLSLEA